MVQDNNQCKILTKRENEDPCYMQKLTYAVRRALDHPFVVNALSAKDLTILKKAYETLDDEVDKSYDVMCDELVTDSRLDELADSNSRFDAEKNCVDSLQTIYLMFADAYLEKGRFYTADEKSEAN